MVARLVDPSGYPVLDCLHVFVLSVKSGTTFEIPQAWWCPVSGAEPV